MSKATFQAILMRPEGVGTWTFISIPMEVSASFNSKGQVKVRGTINGYPFRSTALPMGDGTHYLVVGNEIRQHIGAAQGDQVDVDMEVDQEERVAEIPEGLRQALAEQPTAAAAFEKMSYSHKKEWINWIQAAKRDETRLCRISQAITSIAQGKNLRDLSRRG